MAAKKSGEWTVVDLCSGAGGMSAGFARRPGFRVVGAVLERGIARGEFRPVNVEHTVRLVIAPMLLIAVWRSSFEPVAGPPLDVAGLLAEHLDHLRRALEPEGGR